MRYGMLIDLRKCVGCNACTIACRGQNGTPAGINFNKTKKYETGKYPSSKMKYLPMPCMHCKNPPCMKVCPAGATEKHENGIVTADSDKCIGCRACIIACPYEARQFIWQVNQYYENQNPTPFENIKYRKFEKGTVVKCIFCIDRVAEGLPPACVHTCLSGARVFGDLEDPNSEISKLISMHGALPFRAELGTEPSVYYING
jgi:molybdopterin-containing oxidoreductase family iron-sulfur binding subunit